jgi:hypothetical protein
MVTELTEEMRQQIHRFKEIADRRGIANPNKVQELYNKMFNTNQKATHCAGCIRGRINKMWNELQRIEKEEAETKENKEV